MQATHLPLLALEQRRGWEEACLFRWIALIAYVLNGVFNKGESLCSYAGLV